MRYYVNINVGAVIDTETEDEAKEIASQTLNDFSTVCDLPYPSFEVEVEPYD